MTIVPVLFFLTTYCRKTRKVCELVIQFQLSKSALVLILSIKQVMKTVKADLSNEGCQDILERVRPYRGGASFFASDLHNYLLIFYR